MGYKQKDYLDFYYDVLSALAVIKFKKTGRTFAFGRPKIEEEGPCQRALCGPANNHRYFTYNNNGTRNTQEPNYNTINEPVEETISLSQLHYGDFIDKKFKQRYELYTRLYGGYEKENMRRFIDEVAMEIFVHENKKEIDKILDKIRKYGYDGLTREEKNILFNARK